MADVLSQDEIDKLLNAFSTGELDTNAADEPALKVSNYDFRTANRFSKDQIKTLNIIYDYFSRSFSSYMSGTLRAMCEINVLSVEELKYHEFINSLPSPVILAIYDMPPLVGPTLLELSPDICYSMISRLLGGGGAKTQTVMNPNRSFTEIELVMMERVLRQFLYLINEAWEKVIHVDTRLDRIESNPQFAQIVSLNETVAIITLNCKIGDAGGYINVCIPHLALEPISKKISTKSWYQSSGAEQKSLPPATENITSRINTTRLPVSVVFNETQATVRDVLNLQNNDVIILDHGAAEPFKVLIGNLPKFRAEIGVKDKKYAAKLTGLIREGDTENE